MLLKPVVFTVLAVVAIGCGKNDKESGSPAPKAKADVVTKGTKKNVNSPQTVEEKKNVVVDENGLEAVVTEPVVTEVQNPSEDSKVSEANASPGAKAILSANQCKTEPCFTLNAWSLDFGQVYVHFLVNGLLNIKQFDGFRNSKLNMLQGVCLLETARALREFAEENPHAMQPFKDAGISTVFSARVYDTTDSKSKVLPSLYFIKGSDGSQANASLSRGKWVIRSAITGNKEQDDCQILSKEKIASQLEIMKKQLIAQ